MTVSALVSTASPLLAQTTRRVAVKAPTKLDNRSLKPGAKPARSPDDAARRLIAGGPTLDDVALGAESAELRALHDAERELFPPAMPPLGVPWPNELPFALATPEDIPHVHASGLPPTPVTSTPPPAEGGRDLSWLSHLELPPNLPIHWDARVVHFLEFFKDDPRGRQLYAYWLKRSGRYRDAMKKALRAKSLPEDLVWLAMMESGFDPSARSSAGAMGLWQFMPETARLYGLSVDRWSDQRLHPQMATNAAVDFLADLYRRFGTWELAAAAYDMGYGGLVSVVRRYNTNDYWSLVRLEGAMPWETTLYVPKLLALSIIAHNLPTFGYRDVVADSPIENDPVEVPPGTALSVVATAAGCSLKEIEALNLDLRAGRTPPADPASPARADAAAATYPVNVPAGKGAIATLNLAKIRRTEALLERYVVRFGESIEQIAAARKVPLARLIELNGIAQGELVRGGTVLLLPKSSPAQTPGGPASAAAGGVPATDVTKGPPLPVAVVPSDLFVYPDRRRVFYRVLVGDTLPSIAAALRVPLEELRRWNALDPAARLQEGMTLQAFVPTDAELSHVLVLGENEVRTVNPGSDAFFAYWEGVKGRKRLTLTAKPGENLEQIGRRYQVSAGTMERINHRSRTDGFKGGETVIVYTPPTPLSGAVASATPRGINSLAASASTLPPSYAGTSPPELPPLPSIDQLPELP